MKKFRLFMAVLVTAFFMSFSCYAGSNATSSTLASTIITNARSYLNESTAAFWSDAQLLVWLNQGTIDVAARSSCLETIETKILHQDVISYPITIPFITVKNVIYKSYDEKVTNGSMEADDNWSDTTSAPATNAQSNTYLHFGQYSRKFTPDAQDEGIQSDTFTSVASTTYYYQLYVYPDDGTSVNIYVQKGDDSASIVDSDVAVVQDAWNVISGSYTEGSSTAGSGAYIAIRSPTTVTSGDFYVDDVSIYTSGGIKPLRRGSIEHMSSLSTNIGEPSYWTQWGNDVVVYPKPDSTVAGDLIDIYFIERPTALVSTDYITIPAQYDRALTLYIVEQALMMDEKFGKASVVHAEYITELDRFRQDFNTQPSPQDIR